MAVVLALASAVVYGASDFLGGLASRRTSVFGVVAASQLIGLAALLALLPWLGGPASAADLAWGAAAGLAGSAGLVVFFRTLATGVMSVVAPVTAVTAAAVPVLVGLLGGETIGPWAAAGIALALAAVVLVSAEGGLAALRSARPAALAPALLAGTMFGLFFVALDRTSSESMLTPLVAARVASVTLVVVVALALRQPVRVSRPALPLVAVSGVGDMTANALFLLAQGVLRERLVGAQVAGLLAAAAAIVLITLPA